MLFFEQSLMKKLAENPFVAGQTVFGNCRIAEL